MKKILIGSPIRQKETILRQFLRGLDDADWGDSEVSFYFVDDNKDTASSALLAEFASVHKGTVLIKGDDLISGKEDNNYVCDSHSHHWKSENINRITAFKDSMIWFCIENGYDYLFLIDSDIVLDRRSPLSLLSRNVDIVSNVFWTQWSPGAQLVPQCFWMPDLYQQYSAFNVKMDGKKANQIQFYQVILNQKI